MASAPTAEAWPPGVCVRRSASVVRYWRGQERRLVNCATGVRCRASALEDRILDVTGRWTAPPELCRELGIAVCDRVHACIDRLTEHTMLSVSNRPDDERERALETWGAWHPAASFLHACTKDGDYPTDRSGRATMRPAITDRPYPSPLKSYDDRERIPLPMARIETDLISALRRRRTWRRFGKAPISLQQLSILLEYTWGVQEWIRIPPDYVMPLKTSPSGGCRHSIEAYVMALDVEGLASGTYHYCPDRHGLAELPTAPAAEAVRTFLSQDCFHGVGALFIMCSVFERVQFRYRQPRAYRVIHIEAGHLGQSFCLLATALGLAPFSTAAFADSKVERHLGIDGIEEAPLYLVGVGSRPADVDWAPYEWTDRVPERFPPRMKDTEAGHV